MDGSPAAFRGGLAGSVPIRDVFADPSRHGGPRFPQRRRTRRDPAGAPSQARRPYSARIRLLRGSCSSSARPRASSSGGMYIPKRPRRPFFSPYQPPTGLDSSRAQASTVPSFAGLFSSALPSAHPVAGRHEHGVEVLDRAQLVAQARLADLADDRRRVGRLVAVHRVLRRPRGRLEHPGVFLGSGHIGHSADPSRAGRCRSRRSARRPRRPAAAPRARARRAAGPAAAR